jgi:PAS domain S-box-containing protein
MIMTALFRFLIGGSAIYTGICVIVATGCLGLFWRQQRPHALEEISAGELYLFGIINHVVMLALMLLLPLQTALTVLAGISIPVLLIYPILTVAMGLLLKDRLRRQRTTDALAESEATYRNLFENNHTVMLLVDPDGGRIIDANLAASQLYGWPINTLRQMNISQINTFTPAQMETALQQAKDGKENLFHFQHRTANGSILDVETLSGPVTISGKKLLYSIVHDITASSRAETAREKMLKEATHARQVLLSVIEDQKFIEAKLQRLSTAIEQSPEAIVITDTGGVIQYVNPAFEKISGYSKKEAISQTSHFLQSGQHDAAFYAALWHTISSGQIWQGRFVNKHKNGLLYTEDASISPVRNSSGEISGYVAVKRDITEELQREELFQQSQKMEAVGQLAGGIAHDFNNILQAILGFSEILLSRLQKDSVESRNVDEILKAARRAAELTGQLLAFSRKQPTDRKDLQLNTVIRDSEVLLHMLLGDNTECIFELAPDLMPVYADHNQIVQLIMNLSVNARDAMPDGGRLVIRTENLVFGEQDVLTVQDALPGTYVCMSISDTGYGMNQEVKTHLFEPFFTTKEVGKGTGLGLAVVYGIVKQSKGWIQVFSEEDKGSTFRIGLPASTAPTAEQSTEEHEQILLIEDDEDLRTMVIQLLETAGYDVEAAATAEEALALFRQNPNRFDLLFSDIVLPDQSGLEVADTLRAEQPGLPVLLYSSYRSRRDRWDNLEHKNYRFLQKPFSISGLLAAVHEALTDRTGRR